MTPRIGAALDVLKTRIVHRLLPIAGYSVAYQLIRAIEWCERVIYCHDNARVLADTEWRLSCVLDHMGTGLSKPSYTIEIMRAKIDDRLCIAQHEGVEDFIEELAASEDGPWTEADLRKAAGLKEAQ